MTDITDEIWRPVCGYEGFYEASNMGQVRSVERIVEHRTRTTRYPSRILKKSRFDGYDYVTLCVSGRSKTYRVGTVVLMAFCGPSNGMHTSHENGDSTNDQLSNLKWRTQAENNRMNLVNGTFSIGECHYNAKLNDDKVRYILSSSKSNVALSSELGVSVTAILQVRHGRTWKHVQRNKEARHA